MQKSKRTWNYLCSILRSYKFFGIFALGEEKNQYCCSFDNNRDETSL